MSPAGWWRLIDAYRLLWRARRYRGHFDEQELSPSFRPQRDARRTLLIDQATRYWLKEGARVVDMASRHPKQWAVCIHRSLALVWWLQARGVPTQIRFGVRMDGDNLTAHAWVEYDGLVVNDRYDIAQLFHPLEPSAVAKLPPGVSIA
jgi:hypothetical protein